MAMAPMTSHVTSVDGTRIAYERSGEGPALVLVEAAGHFRGFSSFHGLASLLAPSFSVITYDRRGRGDSSDTPPYAPDREVDDLDALIDAAGGTAFLYGYSSGALLALRAAARGLPISRMALLEPPLQDEDEAGGPDLTMELGELVAAGHDSDAVAHFHESIGVPAEFVEGMKGTPQWASMVSVAHTLIYDTMISDATSPQLLASVTVPTLVLDSEGSSDDLTGWASSVAAQLPMGSHRSLVGEWHTVPDATLAPVLEAFFRGQPAPPPSRRPG